MAGISSVSTSTYTQNSVSAAGNTAQTSVSAMIAASNRQQVNKQIMSFSEAAQTLKKSLIPFAQDGMLNDWITTSASSDSFRVVVSGSLEKLAKAYNNFNDAVKSSRFITGEGAKLLEQVQALFGGENTADFRAMGLELASDTGKLKFDKKKFDGYLEENASQVKKLVFDDKSLSQLLQSITTTVLGKPAGYYFKIPFVVDA